jgi:hypothetical protein
LVRENKYKALPCFFENVTVLTIKIVPVSRLYRLCFYPVHHKVRTYKEYHSVFPSSELGLPPTPHPQASVPPPPCFWGEGNTRWRERGWESPNSDEGRTLWYSLYVRTLCSALFIPKPAFGTIVGTTGGFWNKFRRGVIGGYPKHGKSFRKAFWNRLVFPSIETSKNFFYIFFAKKSTRKCENCSRSDKKHIYFKYSAPDGIP